MLFINAKAQVEMVLTSDGNSILLNFVDLKAELYIVRTEEGTLNVPVCVFGT